MTVSLRSGRLVAPVSDELGGLLGSSFDRGNLTLKSAAR